MAGKAENLVGRTFGQLSVLAFHDQKGNFRRWLCRCSCGNECLKYGNQMKAGQVVSCGCLQKMKASEIGRAKAKVLMGQRFGRLVVTSRAGSTSSRRAAWLCRCDCGNEKVVKGNALLSGNTTSCGCVQKETMHRIRFNPNMTTEERFASRNREAAYPMLHIWRKDVYARAGWICSSCGKKSSGDLVAHHADGWKEHPDKRLDPANGVCLCESCHKRFHETYGYGKNTREQVEEFLVSQNRLVVNG